MSAKEAPATVESGIPFVETAMTRKVWQVCHAARAYQRIAFLTSDSQVGKTTALREYASRNAQTVYVSMPTAGKFGDFVSSLAEACGHPTRLSLWDLRQRILTSFGAGSLLIVDESHQCLLRRGGSRDASVVAPVEFCREVFDRSGCGLLLCSTHTFAGEMESGALAGWLSQTNRRRLAHLRLNPLPTAVDLAAFAKSFGLVEIAGAGEALSVQTAVLEEEGLGSWLTLLRMGQGIARKQGVVFLWEHVVQAWKARARLR